MTSHSAPKASLTHTQGSPIDLSMFLNGGLCIKNYVPNIIDSV